MVPYLIHGSDISYMHKQHFFKGNAIRESPTVVIYITKVRKQN
jgi:hypothetical protein